MNLHHSPKSVLTAASQALALGLVGAKSSSVRPGAKPAWECALSKGADCGGTRSAKCAEERRFRGDRKSGCTWPRHCKKLLEEDQEQLTEVQCFISGFEANIPDRCPSNGWLMDWHMNIGTQAHTLARSGLGCAPDFWCPRLRPTMEERPRHRLGRGISVHFVSSRRPGPYVVDLTPSGALPSPACGFGLSIGSHECS